MSPRWLVAEQNHRNKRLTQAASWGSQDRLAASDRDYRKSGRDQRDCAGFGGSAGGIRLDKKGVVAADWVGVKRGSYLLNYAVFVIRIRGQALNSNGGQVNRGGGITGKSGTEPNVT